ncbi:hypothetical protein [Alkalicoccus luteus]|uniref:Uncharacterized protein n=1 Tax=Alkalicoccus luteus TaxID=1237094 RepID=A0A969PPV8_9BACI|nr:hypothetical protein [Alkalicoccus luteus]NJP37228.1 hypothetical protein [Alkalicoccus luteus]
MLMKADIYFDNKVQPPDSGDHYYVRINQDRQSIRLTPASLAHVCSHHHVIVLHLNLSTNDAFQQGSIASRTAFLYELFLRAAEPFGTAVQIAPASISKEKAAKRHVTSVQTWYEKTKTPASYLSRSYFAFLPKLFHSLIRVDQTGKTVRIKAFGKTMLHLEHDPKPISDHVDAWVVKGGLLSHRENRSKARLWFMRSDLKPGLTYAAITHFQPSMPWVLYKLVQAPLHQFVMRQFAEKRYRLSRRSRRDLRH